MQLGVSSIMLLLKHGCASPKFPWVLAIIGYLSTTVIYWCEITDTWYPFQYELVLGSSELFAWLILFGDNPPHVPYYACGLPFGLLFNSLFFWLLGYTVMKCARLFLPENPHKIEKSKAS